MNGLRALLTVTVLLLLCGCAGRREETAAGLSAVTGRMELLYAERFTVDRYADGTSLVTIDGSERYLTVPAGVGIPEGLPEDVTVLRTPMERLYVASSSAMDPFRRLGALGAVRWTSTTEGNWSLPEVREAMEAGDLVYAGKYSAPDFEALLEEGCSLAVENTMIYHSPEIREQLEGLGIPTLVERSGYEPHPLGRMEWIKLYGLLTGREAEAEAFFREQTEAVRSILDGEDTGKTAAFFYISPNGYVNVRRPGDYVSRMIELAGGHYALTDAGDEETALSTMNMQMEAFYAAAKDADVLIYNATVDGGVDTLEELLEKNALLEGFKAVRDGGAWCTGQNMFQESSGAAGTIRDLHAIFTGETDGKDLTYLYHLE